KWDMPALDAVTFQSTLPKVFFAGDSAFGPKNIITAVAQGHQAAISIDLFLRGESVKARPAPGVTLVSQKMGVHEWSYDNAVVNDLRYKVPHVPKEVALKDLKTEVELGFDTRAGLAEALRCLNCDVQTVFAASKCIECDACVDICPTECINFLMNDEEPALRQALRVAATNLTQDLYVQDGLTQTQRVMVKDENVCLHCGLCAERCPTGAWDMQKFFYMVTKAGH
ncbi:MAG TPA: 4Fe-4S dicluster domain-containing protein, partial [Pseudomonadales bacterium]|nr:4Fe-4S dicluster domain-containing protein [Pseudomonadales bacterium]